MWNAGYNHHNRMNDHFAWLSVVAVSLSATALTAGSVWWISQCIRDYGWEGTLYYIWEGDPYPPNLRDRMHVLKNIGNKLIRLEKELIALEIGYERAILDSVDGTDTPHTRLLWEENVPGKDLKRALVTVSESLDRCAARVDQISTQDNHTNIKSTKKALSIRAVKLMDRADVLMKAYNKD